MKYTWVYSTAKVKESSVDEIVEQSLKNGLVDGKIVSNAKDKRLNKVDKSIRKAKITFLDKLENSHIYNLVYTLGMEINNESFGFDINQLETVQFTFYDSSDKGKYDWHTDTVWVSDDCYHRKLSVVIQLSDPSDYEGGVLEIQDGDFTKQDKINIKQKGSVIVFPSFMEHRVTPVTKGVRMSLIGWMLGAKFR